MLGEDLSSRSDQARPELSRWLLTCPPCTPLIESVETQSGPGLGLTRCSELRRTWVEPQWIRIDAQKGVDSDEALLSL
jgi:hypothetical protein